MTKSQRVVICPWILDQVQQIVWLYIRRDCILLGRLVKFCFIILIFLFFAPFCDIEARQFGYLVWKMAELSLTSNLWELNLTNPVIAKIIFIQFPMCIVVNNMWVFVCFICCIVYLIFMPLCKLLHNLSGFVYKISLVDQCLCPLFMKQCCCVYFPW